MSHRKIYLCLDVLRVTGNCLGLWPKVSYDDRVQKRLNYAAIFTVFILHAQRLLRMRHSGFWPTPLSTVAFVSLSFIATMNNEDKRPSSLTVTYSRGFSTDVSSPCQR